MSTVVAANPFVGPRAISYGEPIYGRDHEIDDLASTLVSQRIVLLYSPSGAGKSSLVEAGVRLRLEERGFHVLPTVRVGHVIETETANRYLMSTKLSLSEAVPPGQRWDQERLASVTFEEHLDRVLHITAEPDRDPCLVFDQFEELFTLDPADWDEKREFLDELGVALRQRSRWALFAMREDYIAQLDPLLSLLPTRLSTRYRLDLLEPDAARLAMVRPAADAGVDFTTDGADHLIDDLRKTHVQRAGRATTVPGRYIEPVVLQAVCRRLWEQSGAQQRIGVADVEALGDVDDALADFCDDRLAHASAESGVSEQQIRGWLERELITDQGFRSQTVAGPTDRGDEVLRALEDGHLLRAESRRGTTWYEIPHDRLVQPIRSSNRRWLDANLDPVQTSARTWDEQGRPDDFLLRGMLLDNAERWMAEHPAEVREVDQEFVDASRDQRRRIERRRLQLLALGLAAVVAALIVAGLLAAWSARVDQAAADADLAAAEAEVAAALAQADALAAAAPALAEAEAQARAEVLVAAAQVEAEQAAAAAEAAQAALEAAERDQADAAVIEQLEAEAEEANDAAVEAAEEAAGTEQVVDDAAAANAAAEESALAVSLAWDGDYEAAPGGIEVRLGHAGNEVGWLQQELRSHGFELTADCHFGRVTEEAVKSVQAQHGLAATGLADNETWTQLGVDVADPVPQFSCEALGQPEDSGLCETAIPASGVTLMVLNVPPDDPDGGLNFRSEPGLQSAVHYAAPNGDVFTATGRCDRIGLTDWLELEDAAGTSGWAGSRLLFLPPPETDDAST